MYCSTKSTLWDSLYFLHGLFDVLIIIYHGTAASVAIKDQWLWNSALFEEFWGRKYCVAYVKGNPLPILIGNWFSLHSLVIFHRNILKFYLIKLIWCARSMLSSRCVSQISLLMFAYFFTIAMSPIGALMLMSFLVWQWYGVQSNWFAIGA